MAAYIGRRIYITEYPNGDVITSYDYDGVDGCASVDIREKGGVINVKVSAQKRNEMCYIFEEITDGVKEMFSWTQLVPLRISAGMNIDICPITGKRHVRLIG